MTVLARIDAAALADATPALAHSTYGTAGPAAVAAARHPRRARELRARRAVGRGVPRARARTCWVSATRPRPRRGPTRAHADALSSWLRARGVDELHLVGFDFGGPTAVLLAAQHRVRSLTLAATNLFPDTPVPLPLRLAKLPGLGALMYRLALGRAGQMAMWRAAVADRTAFPFARYRALLRDNTVRSTRRIFYASMRDLPGLYGEVARAAAALRVPAAVLWGDRDPFFPLAIGERTAETLGAELHVLRGCGHFVPEERPVEMARVIAALVEQAEARSRTGALAGAPP
ncbi:MAG: alpha/beta hydrolase [Nannocystaceae bacterium]